MNFQNSFQRFAKAAIVCALIAISFSSCYRSSGCPGRITYQPTTTTQIDGDC